MKKNCLKSLILFFVLSFSSASFAANTWCNGVITNSYLTANGDLVILGSWSGGYTRVCNLRTTWKSVVPEVCKGWLSMAQTAVVTQKPVIMLYSNISSCKDIPHYGGAPAPAYLMLLQK